MRKRVINGSTAFWLIASAVMIGVIMLQMEDGSWLAPPVTAATADEQERDEGDLLASPLDANWLDAIVERPLFSASRQPFSPARKQPAAMPSTEVKPFALILAGTMLSGEARIALLRHPTGGLLRLRKGQQVDGWRVDEISGDDVRLRHGHEVKLLSLREGAVEFIPQMPDGDS